MTFTPAQIKVATYGGAALLLWLLARHAMPAPARVVKELDIDANVNSKTFGMTWDDIQRMHLDTSNPAVDPGMRDLIDRSNAAIAADDRENGDVNQVGQ